MKIVLASLSERRRSLLTSLGHDVVVIDPKIEECSDENENAEDLSLENARRKARAVSMVHGLVGMSFVVGADTVVTHDGRVFGKPKDYQDAVRILDTLSGNTHQVITSYCLKNLSREIHRSVSSEVAFRKLSSLEIKAYLSCNEWIDKAGGYAVQGMGAALVCEVKGSLTNVIGLPVEEFLFDAEKLINL